MANARIASLLAQRNASAGGLYSGDRIRILSPQNNSVASIARNAATGELNVMVSRYNNGEVGNEEMRAFLTKMSTNIGLSANDKLEVNNQLKDFDSRIIKDKLEANYKAAPDGSLQQLQAAQAIASYYQTRASSQAEGTPAQMQTLQSAADWVAKTNDIKTGIAKVASQNLRYQEEAKINQLPNNSSERASAKAAMYRQLYEKAASEGDSVGANRYSSLYEQQMTTAEELATKESTTSEKKDIKNIMDSYVDAYHDGKINENQYLQLLAELSPRIDATNDYGLINALNRTTDTIQKNLDKGGIKRGVTASGLPTVLGKGKKGLGGSVSVDQQEAFDYSDSLRKLKRAYEDGKISGDVYTKSIAEAVITHAGNVQETIAAFEEIATTNPNAKVLFNGKKVSVSSALESLDKEYEDIKGQAGAVEKGTFAFAEIPPGDFNKSGVIGSGKSFATLKPIDASNIPDGAYEKDVEGIYHQVTKQLRDLTPEEIATYRNGQYKPGGDETAAWAKAKEVSPGVFKTETGGREIKAFKPGTSEWLPVDTNKEGFMPAYTNAKNMLDQDKSTRDYIARKAKERQAKLTDPTKSAVVDQTGNKLSFTGLPQQITTLNKTVDASLKKDANVISPAEPVAPVAPKVISPVVAKPAAPANQVGITPDMRVSMPSVKLPQSTGTAYVAPKTPALQIAAKPPSPVAQMAKNNNIAPVKIQGLQGLPTTKANPKADYSITGSAKALVNNVLSLFKKK